MGTHVEGLAGAGVVVGVACGLLGLRNRHCDPPHARLFFVTALIAFGVSGLLILGAVSPVVSSAPFHRSSAIASSAST
jgi:hypothetical protein